MLEPSNRENYYEAFHDVPCVLAAAADGDERRSRSGPVRTPAVPEPGPARFSHDFAHDRA